MKLLRNIFVIVFLLVITIAGIFYVIFNYNKNHSIETLADDKVNSREFSGEKVTGDNYRTENSELLLAKNENKTVEDKIRRLLQDMADEERSTGEGSSLSAVSLKMEAILGDGSPEIIFEVFKNVDFDLNGDSHGGTLLLSLLEDDYAKKASVKNLRNLVVYLESNHLEWQNVQSARLLMSIGDNYNRTEFKPVFKDLFKSVGLSSGNEVLIGGLANALARIGDPESARLLFGALDTAGSDIQNVILNSLTLIDNENVFPILVEVIESNTSSQLQVLASIQVMGKINSEASVVNLQNLTNDKDSTVAEAASKALIDVTRLRNYDPNGSFGSAKE